MKVDEEEERRTQAKMEEEAGHKAMLYFLEVLMNSADPLTISQLAGRFGSRNFTPEMRAASGGNEVGLKKFLLKYPSLFAVIGNMVSIGAGDTPSSSSSSARNNRDASPASTTSNKSLPDVSNEMESVQYFKLKLLKREEDWLSVRSLAGHLSQASLEVRQCVGPQIDFKSWLIRHPHIFEVQGEMVRLRDNTTPEAFAKRPTNDTFNGSPNVGFHRSRSGSGRGRHFEDNKVPSPTPVASNKRMPMTMTANEYKAVMFVKKIIESKGDMHIHSITGHFSQAPEGVRNTIGWTKYELEEFIKKHSNIFILQEDEIVTVKKNARLNVVITGSRPLTQSVQTLVGRKGKIFHVAKLWGIVDLGKHEHVFFDKSIMSKPMEDLQKEYKVGDILYFNAVLAPKKSRAKWRATRVWKESESSGIVRVANMENARAHMQSPSDSIEDEVERLFPRQHLESVSSDLGESPRDPYADAAPSGAGVIPVWNFHDNEDDSDEQGDSDLSMVPERYYLSLSAMNDLRLVPDYAIPLPYKDANANDENKDAETSEKVERNNANNQENSVETKEKQEEEVNGTEMISESGKKLVSIGCQTVATGEILATQLYYSG